VLGVWCLVFGAWYLVLVFACSCSQILSALNIERQRNEMLFDLYEHYLREDAEHGVSISLVLRSKLEELCSSLRFVPDAVFDVRLVLELQKEVCCF
jgi:hypothetical protein